MAELITAVAQLLWPLIVLAVLVLFRGSFRRVLRTAERRELEVEVGGQKLTMHELNDQQNEMIQDLQRQVSALSAQLQARGQVPRPGEPALPRPPEPPRTSSPSLEADPSSSDSPTNGEASANGNGSVRAVTRSGPRSASEPFAVLWVSDRPESHALLVEQLRNNGVRVTTARTTAEAVELVDRRPYRLVVSDMGRREDGHWQPDAGLALLGELHDLGVDVPVVVFSDQQQYAAQARQAGAVAVTGSAAEMVGHFRNFDLL
jgi:CheY-like chemotaxis protein